MATIDLLTSSSTTGVSTDPARPDYACPAYYDMAPRWAIVDDIRAGTEAIRAKKEKYLPKFEAETPADWAGRVAMTFVADHYATTLTEHVGLVMAEPIKLGDDVPPAIQDLSEDIDGEGNHLDVFAQGTFDAALHLGHCLLWTDYPNAADFKDLSDERVVSKARPYVQLYRADDVLSWQTETVGGVKVLTRIVFRECGSEPVGEFGTKEVVRYREIQQAVAYDEFTGRAKSLGAITWRAWKEPESGAISFEEIGSGTIAGPTRIPARVVYGGERLGVLHSKPHLYGLALSNVEETQIESDYAAVMHKCNVPTPIFIGRNTNEGAQTIQMGQGIDIAIGGDAKYLEPTGVALGATRTRIQDIQLQMQRQGAATAQGEGGKVMTATEAAQYAKARNAKLSRAARSLQDALEGVLADMAAFMGIASTGTVKSGGSVSVTQNIAGVSIDPAYLTVLVAAYDQGTLTMEELRYVLQTGKLPEEFDYANVVDLLANQEAREDAKRIEAEMAARARDGAPPIPAAA